jgi:hypothetical protein
MWGPHAAWFFAIGVPFLGGMLVAFFPTAALLDIFILPIWAIWALILFGLFGISLFKKLWLKAGQRACLLVALFLCIIISRVGLFGGWICRFAIEWPGHQSVIASLPEPSNQKLLLWAWGSYLIFNDTYLAYDGSDGLKDSQPDQSIDLQNKIAAKVTNARWDATHLIGHYYVLDVHG